MKTKSIALFLVLTGCAASCQDSHAITPASPEAVVVRATDIHAAAEQNSTEAISDAVLRVLPIEASYNVGISVVRRSRVNGQAPADAIVHDAITEVYQIIEGTGVLVTGGTIESANRLPADDEGVRRQFGPSSEGTVIHGGTRHAVGPGDIVVIPPHTAHGFAELTSERIVYTLIRIDPRRMLELHEAR